MPVKSQTSKDKIPAHLLLQCNASKPSFPNTTPTETLQPALFPLFPSRFTVVQGVECPHTKVDPSSDLLRLILSQIYRVITVMYHV